MADTLNNTRGNQLEIELSEQEASGTYSNLVMISHSPSEFVLDFICMMPGLPKAKVIKRVIVTPDHAKRLIKALQDNVVKYESAFGAIDAHDRQEFPMQFRGPMPEA